MHKYWQGGANIVARTWKPSGLRTLDSTQIYRIICFQLWGTKMGHKLDQKLIQFDHFPPSFPSKVTWWGDKSREQFRMFIKLLSRRIETEVRSRSAILRGQSLNRSLFVAGSPTINFSYTVLAVREGLQFWTPPIAAGNVTPKSIP